MKMQYKKYKRKKDIKRKKIKEKKIKIYQTLNPQKLLKIIFSENLLTKIFLTLMVMIMIMVMKLLLTIIKEQR